MDKSASSTALSILIRGALLLLWILLCLNVQPTNAGILDYNYMNCLDLGRHMVGTVPSRFGLFGGEARRRGLSRDKRQSIADAQRLFSTVTNLGGANTAACESAARHGACVSIDGFLGDNFPQWWFDYQVTHNLNHVVGQMTTHRYHALFEAGLKAYKCFCEC